MPADWARVNDIFHRVLEEPVARRGTFLDEACAGDAALRAEVASLVAASERADDFIEQPAVASAGLPAALIAPGDALVGRQVGHYRIVRVLGEGGMGIVYLAEDTRLGRSVALKALAPRFTTDPARRERLTREARAAGGLTHPGIATVYALEEFDGQLYISCEYVPGDTLRTVLARGPLPAARAIETALAIARALAAAHDRGIVHRDLKPENIIRTPGGDLKILDFGLARFRDAPAEMTGLTGDGTILGTPAYMSPEQIRGSAVDFRSDLFSLGIVLYELATGVHPFAGRDAASTIAKILESDPRPIAAQGATPTAIGGLTPNDLEPVILTCLKKDADARYRSTQELIAALEGVRPLASGPIEHVAISRVADPPAAGQPARGPRWWWEFHQVAAGAAYSVLLVPLWLVHTWTPGLAGLLMFLCGLVGAIAATTLRLHLVFTVRSYPAERAEQQRSTSPWIRTADLVFTVVLITGAAFVLTSHTPMAVVLVASAVGVGLSSTVIEPATTRAAFGEH